MPRPVRLAVSVLFLGLLTFTACAPARRQAVAVSAGPPDFAVVTWNQHDGGGNLRALVEDLASGKLTAGRPAAFALLLQEAAAGHVNDLFAVAARAGLHAHFAPVHGDEMSGRGNAILSAVPLRDLRVIQLPRERQRRLAMTAQVDVAGGRWTLVNAHLENRIAFRRGAGLLSDAARGRQAAALLKAVPAGPRVILGGDLNTWLGPREPAWRLMAERFPETSPGRLQPTFRDRLTLDHLFFDLPEGWRVTRTVVRARYGSDHHPVLGMLHRQRAVP